ncbi:conserved hypothetical protein [Talaromyces stipitatus ATCC 10500]|uniref:Tat pathway signal sequence n=1 Tax=Talaromyces stipitatus (strain ATCC 10500 / CBS 375.48 / QM 6759 / NRRL 1006) TaxID=441959 RepID=B8MJT9_TALSN|nr:uncharacterized protein TSTA_042310 [Talaromyces stipitatus ATCC 10500]EED14756.1 conserved hypothetical protein [Talaromyces stipitatus ATCC 10500]
MKFWPQEKHRSGDYKRAERDSNDSRFDEGPPLTDTHGQNSLDSETLLDHDDEKQIDQDQLKQHLSWSVRDKMFKQVDGELFPAKDVKDQLLGRLEPGPVLDDLWQDYEMQRNFMLTREQVIAMGKDPEMAVKLPDEIFGLGQDAYLGGLDAFHILHCFNAIRTEAFKDYYFDGERYHMEGYGPDSIPKRNHSEMFWIHLRHCSDIIVQFLMCNADTTMTTYSWIETQERPFPDFSVNKKCIDFDTLVRWRDDNALDFEDAGMIRRPPGAYEVAVSEIYWQIMGNETHPGDKRHHPLWD